jgi:hypothetical protein
MGFTPTRVDQDLWYHKANSHAGYVDNIAIAALRPAEYRNMIEQEFWVRNKEDIPSYYLGNDLKLHQDGHLIHVLNKTYITKVLRKYHLEHRALPKKNIPMYPNAHSELDTSEPLDEDGMRQYQKIIGIEQWQIRHQFRNFIPKLLCIGATTRPLSHGRRRFGIPEEEPKQRICHQLETTIH